MRNTISIAFAFAVTLPVGGASAQSVPELPAPSPAAKVMQRVGLTDIKVTYSSPAKRKRRIYGKLVPYNKLWRTGANSATTIEFSRDVMVAGTKVAAGAYAIFTIPAKSGWTFILNSNTEQGGTGQYDEKLDVARVKTKKPALVTPRRERMTFLFSNTTEDSTRLDLEWDRYRISVPISVDTDAHVKDAVAKAENLWQPFNSIAMRMLDKGDLKAALAHSEKSTAISANWFNTWYQAQILDKMGDKAKAKAAYEKVIAFNATSDFFKSQLPSIQAAIKRLQ